VTRPSLWRRPETRLVLWTCLIAFVVIPWMDLQNHTHWMKVQWIPFVTPPVKVIDIVVNILLYWPFGYWFGKQAGDARAWRRACLYALALSLATEWTQLYSHSRFPSLTDTTCNVIGTALGAFFAARGLARVTRVPVEGGVS